MSARRTADLSARRQAGENRIQGQPTPRSSNLSGTVEMMTDAKKELLTRQMFTAAVSGDMVAFCAALEAGISVNLIDPASTDTPLMLACRADQPDIVNMCLRFGARNDPHPDFGQTALHAAVSAGAVACTAAILHAAAPSKADSIICNLKDPKGSTPLHVACSLGNVELVELLVSHGAELSRKDAQGRTPLHVCAATGQQPCLAFLLDHGADEVMEERDQHGNTALHHAAQRGNLAAVKLLLETAADVNVRNDVGQTPYNTASLNGHQQIGLLLLKYIDPNSNATPRGRGTLQPAPQLPQVFGGNPAGRRGSLVVDVREQPLSTPRANNFEFYDQATASRQFPPHQIQSAPIYNSGVAENRLRNQKQNQQSSSRSLSSHDSSSSASLPRPHTAGSPGVLKGLGVSSSSPPGTPNHTNSGYRVVKASSDYGMSPRNSAEMDYGSDPGPGGSW